MLVRRGTLARVVVLIGAAIPCGTFAFKMRADAARCAARAPRRAIDTTTRRRDRRDARGD